MTKLILSMLLLIAPHALAAPYQFTKANNHVNWTAVGTPGFLRINGAGGAAEGKLEAADGKVSGELTVQLADYTTGLDLRDHHMKEKYLDVAKYPAAKLVLASQPYAEGKESTISGDLTIKDVTKAVKITFTATGKNVQAKFKINIKDYPSIGVPAHLGITVADEVEVLVDAKL